MLKCLQVLVIGSSNSSNSDKKYFEIFAQEIVTLKFILWIAEYKDCQLIVCFSFIRSHTHGSNVI